MFITVHPVDRVLPATLGTGWAAEALELVADGGGPVASWVTAQVGASQGAVVCAWPDEDRAGSAATVEGTTPARVVVGRGRVFRVQAVHPGTAIEEAPGVLQLTWFDGPRTEAHLRADELSDRRITAAHEGLAGLCGAVSAYGPGNARLVAVFADTVATLEEGLARILGSELLPSEDPALLTGPDLVQVGSVLEGSGSIQVLTAGAVR